MIGGWLNTRKTWSHETRPMEDEKQREAHNMTRPNIFSDNFSGILWFILPLYLIVLWIFNYGDTFGERDSYRVLVGIVDAITHGKPFLGGLMYGQDASPGYYAVLQYIIPRFGIDIHNLARALNNIALICSILCLVPLYIIAKSFGGRSTALSAIVLIYTVPVWWSVSEYAHPIWPALLFFLLALALTALRPAFSGLGKYFCDGTVTLALAISFSMRMDAVLMAPMMLAFCLDRGRVSFVAVLRLVLCGLAALAVVGILKAVNPNPLLDTSAGSVWSLFVEYHNFSRFVLNFKNAQFSFARAVNPFLLTSFVASVIYMICKRDLRALLLIVPTVAINYLFWIPNDNTRHFLYLVPALVFGVARVTGDLMDGALSSHKITKLCAISGLVFVGISSVLHPIFDGKTIFFEHAPLALLLITATCQVLSERFSRLLRVGGAGMIVFAASITLVSVAQPSRLTMKTLYPLGMGAHYTGLGKSLLALPPLGKTVLVIADAYPIIAAMQMNASPPIAVALVQNWTMLYVKSEHNDFKFFIQGWRQQDAVEAAIGLSADTQIALLTDPAVAPDVAAILSDKPNIQLLSRP